MVWRSEGCTRGDKLLWGPAPLYLQNCQVWKKNPYMPHYQPIIPSCLVKLKRGLNPDLTGVIKLIFFFPAQRKILDVEHRHLCLLKNCFIIMCTDPVFVCVWCVGFFFF